MELLGLILIILAVIAGVGAGLSYTSVLRSWKESLLLSVLAAALLFVGTAMLPMHKVHAADFYGIVGVGKGNLEQVKQDKWWYQERSDHRWEEGTNVYKVGVGLDVSRYLALEVDYRDLGRFMMGAQRTILGGH